MALLLPVCIPQTYEFLPSYLSRPFFVAISITSLSLIIILIVFFSRLKIEGFSSIDLLFTFFAGYALIRFAIHPLSHWSQGKFLFWLALFVQYPLFRVIFSKLNYQIIYCGLMLLAIFQILVGQLQLLNLLPSLHIAFLLTGTFSNPSLFAGFLSMLFPLAFFEVLNTQENPAIWRKYLGWIVLLGTLLVIAPVNSKPAWLATIAGSSVVLVYRYNLWTKIKKLSNAYLISIGGAVVTLISIGVYFLHHYKFASSDGHLLIWKVSVLMWSAKPVLGIGLTRFAPEYNLAQANYFENGGSELEQMLSDNNFYVFNDFLHIAVELGLLGLLLWLGLLGTALLTKSQVLISIPIKGGLIAWIIFSFFSYPILMWAGALLLFLFLAQISNNQVIISKSLNPITIIFKRPIVSLTLILTSSFLAFWTARTYPAVENWKKAVAYYRNSQLDHARTFYAKAFSPLAYDGLFLQNIGECYLQLGQHRLSNQLFSLSKEYYNSSILYCNMALNHSALNQHEAAEHALLFAHKMVPNRFYTEYLLAKIYYAGGKRKEASILAQKLLDTELKVKSTAKKEMLDELKIISSISFSD